MEKYQAMENVEKTPFNWEKELSNFSKNNNKKDENNEREN